MATITRRRTNKKKPAKPAEELPLLENGDRMTRAEFRAIYERIPNIKAELIEGRAYVQGFYDSDRNTYMSSPVSHQRHGGPHIRLSIWLGNYMIETDGTDAGDNSSLLMDLGENEPQPDLFLRILPNYGGQSRDSDDGFIEGAPELIAEIAASSKSYDLHDKLAGYQRNGVLEYIVWRTTDQAVDWFVLREGQFHRHQPERGVFKSLAFPGLWLESNALIAGDGREVQRVLKQGLRSAEHQAFVKRLAGRKAK